MQQFAIRRGPANAAPDGRERTLPPPSSAATEKRSASAWPGFDFGGLRIQPKLTIGQTDDPLEREADRAAETAMRMPDGAPPVGASSPGRTAGSAGIPAPPIVHEVLRSSGRPLDTASRAFMEPRFGHDFSQIRVHTGLRAHAAAAEISARAFTSGRDIVFGCGEYAPATRSGNELLAHELAHVVQQGTGIAQTVARKPDDDGAKAKAELDKKKTKEKLEAGDVEYILERGFGKNVLKNLSLPMPSSAHPLSVLEAGALAFTLGMLRQRSDFFAENEKKYGKTPPFLDPSYYSIKDKEERIRRKNAGIQYVAWYPDFPATFKKNKIKAITNSYRSDAVQNIDPYETKQQSEITTAIKVNAQIYFDNMKLLGWIRSDGAESDVKMPDQMLAAVGNAGESTGLADGWDVGVGYFMYSETGKREALRTPDLFRTKAVTIAFPSSGPLTVRASAYGFDQLGSGVNTNLYPTSVVAFAGDSQIASLTFDHKDGKNVSAVKENKPDIDCKVEGGAITMTIPATYKSDQGIAFQTQIIEGYDPRTGANDADEIQVQFSTTGAIAENKTQEKQFTTMQDVPFELAQVISLEGVNFDTDKSTLKPESDKVLDKLVATLTKYPTMKIEIQGHTDDQGGADHNWTLSQDRAKTVSAYLAAHKIDPARLTTKGFGQTMPIAPNTSEDGRAKNRRVVFVVRQK